MTATLTVTVGFAAFSFDLSRFRMAKGELSALADAAALNAANGLVDNTYAAKANAVAAENQVDGVAASIPASAVVPGYWSGTAFTANGTPRNAVRVTVTRTKANNTHLRSYLASALGWASPDLSATSTVALINQSSYEWAAVGNVNMTASNSAFKVTAFDATAPAQPETQTTVKADGSVTLTGNGTFNTNVKYGTTASMNSGAAPTGSIAQNTAASTYPPGSQVANINGVSWAATTSMTFTSNYTVPGGTYVLKDFTASNCNVTFTGPTTIIVDGSCTIQNSGITTSGNLPKNLKFITTKPGSTVNIINPTKTIYADFYAPGSNFNFSSASGYFGLRGRGIFNSMTASGAGASLLYDRSMAGTSESRKAVVVE